MPRFTENLNIDVWEDVDIDIDVEDFFDEMTDEEKQEMLELLAKDGFGVANLYSSSGRSSWEFESWEFDEAVFKLKVNYHQLTNEETDLIIKLAKRF